MVVSACLLSRRLISSFPLNGFKEQTNEALRFYQQDVGEDNMARKDIAMLGPVMLRQYNKLKVTHKR